MFRLELSEFLLTILLALLILMLYYIISNFINNIYTYENVEDISYDIPHWTRNKCKYMMSQTIQDELKNNRIERSDNNWNVYFPCTYDEINNEINEMPIRNNAKYFIIENCDEIVAKEWLWRNVVQHYGYEKAITLLPNSYILNNNDELDKFKNDFNEKNIYIMKKNLQRQEGLVITSSKNDILNGYKNEFIIAQELLQDPYLIAGRKTNIRFYVLIICKGNTFNVFVHNNGFIYYTSVPFKKNSLERNINITTGYIERSVYDKNPLTHTDLRIYLDNEDRELLSIEKNIINQGMKLSDLYFNRIYNVIKEVFIAFVGKLCGTKGKKKFNDTNTTFQLFGIDVGVNDKLNPIIMEVNKGPDLSSKDTRDSELKHEVIRDVFKLVGIMKYKSYEKSNFINVLNVDNGIIRR